VSADKLLELLRLSSAKDHSVFAFLHTYQVHGNYSSPKEYHNLFDRTDIDKMSRIEIVRYVGNLIVNYQHDAGALTAEQIRTLRVFYDRAIRYTDDTLRYLFAELAKVGFLDDCLVIVISDHGEEFGEHGGLQHRGALFEELIHIPLILQGIELSGGQVDSRMAGNVDVLPTILDYLGIQTDVELGGRSLLGSPPEPEKQFVFTQYANIAFGIRTPRFKLVHAIPLESLGNPSRSFVTSLYDLNSDPKERNDVSALHPEVVDDLRRKLEETRSQLAARAIAPVKKELASEEIERLKSLGYLR
jgi:arylsulfatase A-like enzyme